MKSLARFLLPFLPQTLLDTVTLQAGNNLKVEGSNVVSTNGTTLEAGQDIAITSVADSSAEVHESKKSKSGFSAMMSLPVWV